ncbi:MAG: hypothetical protein AAB953_03915 [Patescibacteria group bacterium]
MNFIKYLLSPNPGTAFKFYIPLAILIVVLIATAIAFSIIYNHRKKQDFAFKRLFKRTSTHLLLLGLLLLFLTGVRYENIPYFSTRILLYLSLLLLLYFLYKTIKTYRVDYPREKQNAHHVFSEQSSGEIKKYSPSKKKR